MYSMLLTSSYSNVESPTLESIGINAVARVSFKTRLLFTAVKASSETPHPRRPMWQQILKERLFHEEFSMMVGFPMSLYVVQVEASLVRNEFALIVRT